jgi:O-antigen ligase
VVKFILRWIWPVYGFVFPLLFWTNSGVTENHLLRICVTVLFVLVGGVLEFHVYGFPRWNNLVRRHPVPLAALVYGLWTLVATLFSPLPIVSLTGDLNFLNDGALWTISLSVLLCLVYTRTRRDTGQEVRLVAAIISSGLVLSVMGAVEIIQGKGLLYSVPSDALPTVTFPGPGHLGGFLVLSGALAVGWWLRSNQTSLWMLPAVVVTGFGLALTNRRATLVALGAGFLAGLNQPIRVIVVAVTLGAGILGGQQLVSFTAAQGVRSFEDTGSLKTRSYLWKAAAGGIAARPIVGWGSSGFLYAWQGFLSRKDLADYLRLEFHLDIKRVTDIFETPGGPPAIIYENQKGVHVPMTLNMFKAHNQFMDIALMWGVTGLVLYILIAVLTAWNFYLPGFIALACYQLFLLLWYVPLEAEGLVFLLVGFTTAMGYRPVRMQNISAKSVPIYT